MNTLSWFIYFAGVSSGIKTFLGLGCFGFLAIVCCIIISCYAVAGEDKSDAEKTKMFKQGACWVGFVAFVQLMFWLICVSIPDKPTLYGIAASQVGEQVLKTSTGEKATIVLDKALDTLGAKLDQIKSDSSESSSSK